MAPLASYRLQFNSNFRFRDAIGILDYLRGLGISHVYALPLLTSRHGSGHGYDVTDPTKIDSDLGGDEDFALFQSALEERGMGLVLDIVPNHMAACYQGAELWDLRLVDPDNRDAIDYEKRQTALKAILRGTAQFSQQLLASWPNGNVKLHVFVHSLAARKNRPELFAKGRYLPLDVSGTHADRIVAFAREYQGDWAIVVLPHCVAAVKAPILALDARREFCKNTILRLPQGASDAWTNVFAGNDAPAIPGGAGGLPVGEIFRGFPVALLRMTR
jgi:maltooligosyltrehalose synthase